MAAQYRVGVTERQERFTWHVAPAITVARLNEVVERSLQASKGPHETPVWIDHDGDDILVNTAKGRTKAVNMERDPKVAVAMHAPEDPYLVVALRGEVTEITPDGPTTTSTRWPRSTSAPTAPRTAGPERSG